MSIIKISKGEERCIAVMIFAAALLHTAKRIKTGEIKAEGTINDLHADEIVSETLMQYRDAVRDRLEKFFQSDRFTSSAKSINKKVRQMHERIDMFITGIDIDLELLAYKILYNIVLKDKSSHAIKDVIAVEEIQYVQDLIKEQYESNSQYLKYSIRHIKLAQRVLSEVCS